MKYNLWLFVILWCCVFFGLRLYSQLALTSTFITLGSLLLAGITADLLVKLAVNLMPRKLLPDLHKKAVLITGCSSGFGLRLAKRLDAIGVTVYAGMRNPQCPGALELKESCTENLHIVVLDVTKDQDVQDSVAYVQKTLGDKEFWAVVNNAGIATGSLLELTPLEEFQKVWETNALGSVRVTKAFMPLLRKFMGRVVLVNSSLGVTATPGIMPYSMSKFALRCFGDALRREMKKLHISVHSIYPYFYKTSMTDFDRNMEMLDNLWKHSPEEVRSAYGEKFFSRCKESSKKFLVHQSSSNINEPVDDIIDATVGATPDICYVPGWTGKFYYFLEGHLSAGAVDYVVSAATGVF